MRSSWPLPGTSVSVCEPQLVSTDLMYLGLALSLMSKILTPSQDSLIVALWPVLLHESLLRELSTALKSRLP